MAWAILGSLLSTGGSLLAQYLHDKYWSDSGSQPNLVPVQAPQPQMQQLSDPQALDRLVQQLAQRPYDY